MVDWCVYDAARMRGEFSMNEADRKHQVYLDKEKLKLDRYKVERDSDHQVSQVKFRPPDIP
jgi:hypothetical protein